MRQIWKSEKERRALSVPIEGEEPLFEIEPEPEVIRLPDGSIRTVRTADLQ